MRVDGAARSGEHALRGRDDSVDIRIRHGRAQEPMVGRAHQNALGQHAIDEMPDHAVADIRSGVVEPYERRGREADGTAGHAGRCEGPVQPRHQTLAQRGQPCRHVGSIECFQGRHAAAMTSGER